MLHGFLNIDKPAGMTSHDVVARVRRAARQKRVGHGGTLDPAATGVLPVALGEATRLLPYLVDGRKRYLAAVRLGVTTTTDDAEGETVREQAVPPLDEATLRRVLDGFVGQIAQVPPMYSAIQVDGQRLYDLARRGVELDLQPRVVEIDRIDLVQWQSPLLTLDVRCGKGTYIRALARDIGATLGCGAHLATLRRTEVGSLHIDDAAPLLSLVEHPLTLVQLAHYLMPPEMAVAHLPRVDADEPTVQRIRNGLPFDGAREEGDVVRVHSGDGTLLALARYDAGAWRPFRVFGWRDA
jgi:tRNA pseudouridine55 synthase